MRQVDASVLINCTGAAVINAFLDPVELKGWWGVKRSFVERKPEGLWVLAWEISGAGMKYVSSGLVEKYEPSSYLSIRHLVYLNPEKQILGPMKLEVFAEEIGPGLSNVKVIQSGYQYGGDWDWYYEAVLQAWPIALGSLKEYLEQP